MPDDAPMPEAKLQYLLDLWAEAGLGADWQAIHAWHAATGTRLSGWELAAIKGMAATYVAAFHQYDGKASLSPWASKQAPAPATGSILSKGRRK